MNMIEPLEYTKATSDPSAGGLTAVGLGFLVLMFLLYDHFERQIRALTEQNIETQARFAVTEDKLATLGEIEDSVHALEEAADEQKSSWEDDVTEPGKYQAIIGKGKVGDHDIEIRMYNESFNTFKSNRYWILNDAIRSSFICFLNDSKTLCVWNPNFKVVGDRVMGKKKNFSGIDSIMCIECYLPNCWPDEKAGNTNIPQILYDIDAVKLVWKRTIIDCPADS